MNLGWAIAGWIGAGVVWGGTLIWSSRYRRDRDRPTGGLHAVFGGLIGLDEILSPDTYDTSRPNVPRMIRWGLVISTLLFFGGTVLGVVSQ